MLLLAALLLTLPAADWDGDPDDVEDRKLRRLDAEFWDFLPAGTRIERCRESTPEWTNAAVALDALDARIQQLPLGADHVPLASELLALLRTPCFRLAIEARSLPRPDTALSLVHWWRYGGHAWLKSFLKAPLLGKVGELRAHVVLPPDNHPYFTRATRPGGELAEYVCPPVDDDCDATTRGWRTRAESELSRPRPNPFHDEDMARRPTPQEDCTRHWSLRPIEGAYQSWLQCLNGARLDGESAFPLVRIKAPTSGWLVVRGRMGHYDFCDVLSAYDLDTGTAYLARRCSSLLLKKGGSVDQGGTRAREQDRLRIGHVNVDNLRELAWSLLIGPEARAIRGEGDWVPLPSGFEPVWIKGREYDENTSFRFWGPSTAQTELTITLLTSTRMIDRTIAWPWADAVFENHSTELLKIVDRGFVAGCAYAALPVERLFPGAEPTPGGVAALDASPTYLREVNGALRADLIRVAKEKVCATGK